MAVVEVIVNDHVARWFPGPSVRLGLSNSGRAGVEDSEAAPPSLSPSCHNSNVPISLVRTFGKCLLSSIMTAATAGGQLVISHELVQFHKHI